MIALSAPTTAPTAPQCCHGGFSSAVLSHPSGLCGACARPQPVRPALVVVMHRRGLWRVNLTDRSDTWGLRTWTDPRPALCHVYHLLRLGNAQMAFQSALIDLQAACVDA